MKSDFGIWPFFVNLIIGICNRLPNFAPEYLSKKIKNFQKNEPKMKRTFC